MLPRTIDEFHASVPFTTYEDFEPFLSEKREDTLAQKPVVWCHSSGRGGRFKWVPHSVWPRWVLARVGERAAEVITAFYDDEAVESFRARLPLLQHRRPDAYA